MSSKCVSSFLRRSFPPPTALHFRKRGYLGRRGTSRSMLGLRYLWGALIVRAYGGLGDDPVDIKSLDLDGVAGLLKSGKAQNIAFLTGAGISVGAGIPDFRSPGGMYDTLRPELLTATREERRFMAMEPSAVVSWDIFRGNQFPYLELRRPFILGIAEQKWKPTLSHFFIKLCDQKNMLKRLYTQNIDGLDYPLGIDKSKIVPVHGSLGIASCEFCGADYPFDKFRQQVSTKIRDIYGKDSKAPNKSENILCLNCKKPGVKPNTVLYGRSLPKEFDIACRKDFPNQVDILFVVGTSLTVGPANSVVYRVNNSCIRVIVNREPVGSGLGIKYGKSSIRDVFCSGNCDDVFLDLAQKLGWLGDLEKYIEQMAPKSSELLKKRLEVLKAESKKSQS
ncbi:hypothetical protein AAMO2058_000248200 [Amorphochlora amoebiformis]